MWNCQLCGCKNVAAPLVACPLCGSEKMPKTTIAGSSNDWDGTVTTPSGHVYTPVPLATPEEVAANEAAVAELAAEPQLTAEAAVTAPETPAGA